MTNLYWEKIGSTQDRIRRLLSMPFFIVVVMTPFRSVAEVNCSADVSYRWLPRVEAAHQDKKESAPNATPSPVEPLVIKWATLTRTGREEASTRSELQRYVGRERQLAMDGCRETHENLARCITAKFSSAGQAMVQLGFTARKALEEAIQQDCKAIQGQCRDVVVGEVSCAVTLKDAPAGETPAATPEEPAAKEGGKEKSKKK